MLEKTTNILITGAAGDFGGELATQLGRRAKAENLELILLDNNVSGLDKVADAIESETDYEPLIYPLDLEISSIDEYTQMATAIADQIGHLDVLIHAAARFNALSPMVHTDPLEWLRVMQTNLNGPWLLTRCCVDLLKQAGKSKLVYLLEDLDTMKAANWGSYGASKVALAALVGQLAGELQQDNIAVASINPGPMRTSLRAKAWMPSSTDPAKPVDEVVSRFLEWLEQPEQWSADGAVNQLYPD